jgi:hypothetical protein
MGNKIRKEQLGKLQEIMRSKPNLVSLCGIADDASEADLSGISMDADDVSILASELPNKGALTSLNVSMNKLTRGMQMPGTEEWTHPLPDRAFEIETCGVGALAKTIHDSGSISKFTFSGDFSSSKSVTMETTMTVANFSGKVLGVSGAIVLSAFLPKCT